MRTGRPAGCTGFTIIELLVVIAIVVVSVALLLPAVQVAREYRSADVSRQTLSGLIAAAESYAAAHGAYPDNLAALGQFCAGTCPVDPDVFTYGRYHGQAFQIVAADPTVGFAIEAEPLIPGVTGADTCVASPGRQVACVPTPGANAGRQRMFDDVLAEAARLGGGLLVTAPSAASRILWFLDHGGVDDALRILDRNNDGRVGLMELYDFPGALAQRFDGLDVVLEVPLREFLQAVAAHMKLETLDEAAAAYIVVPREAMTGEVRDPLYSFAGWCRITRAYVTERDVADRLCRVLERAAVASERGDDRSLERHLSTFRRHLDEQVHRTVTRDRARVIGALLDAYTAPQPPLDRP